MAKQDMTEAVTSAINLIAEKIVQALSEEQAPAKAIGFHRRADMGGNSLVRAWIGRCGPGERFCWYQLVGDRDNPSQQAIEEDCVSGRLIDVQLVTREYKGKENQKLILTLAAGTQVIAVTTGLDTVAGRSILRGLLGHLEKGAITGLVTLQVKPGDSEGTVLVSVLQDGEWAYSEPLVDAEHAVRMVQHQMGFTPKADGGHGHGEAQAAPAAAAAAAATRPAPARGSAAPAVNEEIPF